MLAPLAARGPDGEGHFVDAEAGCAIGHRRLSIIDPSPRGAQPMTSRCGRYVLAFNGEVYNHADLASRLDADERAHCGRSDTAVLLAVLARYGVQETLPWLHAMYAFALWDRAERRLTLARDPVGIKPLVVARQRGQVAFGSTLAALRAWPGFDAALSRPALALYARLGYVPAPACVFANARKLEPGEVLTVSATGDMRSERIVDWRADIGATRAQLAGASVHDLAAQTAARVDATVRQELVSDRPVGVFLSGGIDSSLIAASMVQASGGPVASFAAGFDDPTIDESRHAEAVARALGLTHVTLAVTPRMALEALPALIAAFDEPLSDMAAVPLYLLAQRAKQDVGVVLTGDGGDEVFAGYARYERLLQLDAQARRIPAFARRLGAAAMRGPAGPALHWATAALGRAATPADARAKWARFADALSDPSRRRLYRALITLWPDPAQLVGGTEPPFSALEEADAAAGGTLDFAQRVDLASYLPDALFVKTDRATMAHGLEARVPLAARELIAFGLAHPEALRRDAGGLKAVLRAVARQRLGGALMDRPKQGFSVPMAAWLRDPLREWAESLIGPAALKSTGLFDPRLVSARWQAHVTGTADFSYSLWAILMAQGFAARSGQASPT
jgi:asparagine synthase (glutamine-hydrolysing)